MGFIVCLLWFDWLYGCCFDGCLFVFVCVILFVACVWFVLVWFCCALADLFELQICLYNLLLVLLSCFCSCGLLMFIAFCIWVVS